MKSLSVIIKVCRCEKQCDHHRYLSLSYTCWQSSQREIAIGAIRWDEWNADSWLGAALLRAEAARAMVGIQPGWLRCLTAAQSYILTCRLGWWKIRPNLPSSLSKCWFFFSFKVVMKKKNAWPNQTASRCQPSPRGCEGSPLSAVSGTRMWEQDWCKTVFISAPNWPAYIYNWFD